MSNVRSAVGIVGLLVGLLLALAILAWLLKQLGLDTSITLPVLAISGVILMLASLALVSISFSVFDLDDKTQALALPNGSIRSVIALSLIVLFAILSVFLYSSLSSPLALATIGGLTDTQVVEFRSKLPNGYITSAGPDSDHHYTVYYYQPRDTAGDDFAKQLLVMIGTLVTSVAGFYFGSQTATSAAQSAVQSSTSARPAPILRAINPTSQKQGTGPVDYQVSGDNLDLVKEVKIVLGSNQVIATDLSSNASLAKCRFTVPVTAPVGAWDVVVTDGTGAVAKLPGAVNITV
jgi:hypothetical protein